jgi:ATP-binding protein involved in chromosome partitioning
MPNIKVSSVELALSQKINSFMGLSAEADVVKVRVSEAGEQPEISVTLGFPAARIAKELHEILSVAASEAGASHASIKLDWKVRAHRVQGNLTPMPGVRNVIAVASGKGGVGKSTTAVNLALALADEGARVGILDADIYGPSQPKMLGLSGEQPVSKDGKTFEPLIGCGLETNSVGFLVSEDKPVIWRGPMVTQALNQLVFQTNWGDLDYLIVDMPPGTGDTQLTLTQKVPVAGVVIVTTPQDIALLDARRGLKMFEKVGVSLLGIVENMSTYICQQCGHEEALFGAGGGDRLAAESQLPLLGKLPLHAQIQREADSGKPTVLADPEGALTEKYRQFARLTAATLAATPRDMRGPFGAVVVE